MNERVGIIGLGLLGSAIAERLVRSDIPLIGFDIDIECGERFQELGGELATNAADVAATCSRVLLSLPTTAVVLEVAHEMESRLRTGQTIIDTTTGNPEATTSLGRRLAARGVHYLDATVMGSSAQARKGDVIVMVGGDRTQFEAARDLFSCFARRAFHVGPSGNGAKMKLVANLVLGLNRAVLAEGISFARDLGLDPGDALAVLRESVAYSRTMDTKGQKMIEMDFTTQARLSQHLKDVRLILAAGKASGASLPLSTLHRKLLEAVERAGYGEVDNSAIVRAFDDDVKVDEDQGV